MRVEFGCHEDRYTNGDVELVPFIAVEMPDGGIVNFKSDLMFSEVSDAEAFCVWIQSVLAQGHDRNPTKKHHWGGRDSELV